MIDFQTDPSRYRHWRLQFDGPIAQLVMDVDPAGGLFEGYELKLNSYDLGVDIELADAVQRLRFEHPEVGAVVIRSGKENVFCAGANIRMLGKSSHGHKVGFCKFTNETRCAIEDASENSGQRYLAAINGTAAGGGYELAVATDHILLIDDRRSTVSLPETPLLAVLPGTGGLTRVTDKRKVRRDLADVFCSTEEGVRGKRAVEWRLVDEVVPPSAWEGRVMQRAAEIAARSDRPREARGVALTPLERRIEADALRYGFVSVAIDRAKRQAVLTVTAPQGPPPEALEAAKTAGFWPLQMARELDDAMLHLRLNEPEIGLWVLRTEGDSAHVLAHDAFLEAHKADWFVREVRLSLKRVLKRLDMTSRSLVALIEPGSCFAGTLAELAFAADRSVMRHGAALALSPLNHGAYPMANGLTRLEARFYGEPASLDAARARPGAIEAEDAEAMGLVTFAYDEVDWEDEVRIMLEERTSFSPDALTGMEANLRFVGPETMETRIFGRLTAWQNWIFQRPNSVGEQGALKLYGSGVQPSFDRNRV
ncbi:MAG: Benzoyl-CoA-dihydrodiol lyase [uncultured Craurococcus sp.]|uniref:Benzoyl-CoA-dihydrodiol lyase n=1 Tax=uncultured Craurococcus sp. TaxID=1135998 RepID=A0A6J4IP81_9PROT|nr:MAG: Benzoyl-CoA-dihydrodiol lyase [uncultured Craurococcus sp.]